MMTSLIDQQSSEDVLGYTTFTSSVEHLVGSVVSFSESNEHCDWLACLNPHSYVVALDDPEFMVALKDANWLVPDGTGIVLASKILGGVIRERITGSDIFYALNERMNELGSFSVFFLGATEECLADIQIRMAHDYPDVRFAGCYSPPFKSVYNDAEVDAMISAINDSCADVLWVGMTAPKQEKWLYQYSGRLNVKYKTSFWSGSICSAESFSLSF